MPSVTRASRNRPKREEIVRRLVEAVENELGQGTPYTEISVLRIAEQAQIARSTFYLHFPDKSRLLIAVADQAVQGLFDAAARWWSADHGDGPAGVERAMREMLTHYRAHPRVLRALAELSYYDEEVAAYWLDKVAGFVEVEQRRLEDEQRAGRVSADLDPKNTARLLAGMVERAISLHCHIAGPDEDPAMARALARSIWLTVYG
ncbi:TetR/AcrR family transcriptional regulator [Amycolatopsis cynarae]|uniref:TetR/AcrR family transcriptional regulator n=1 Tax=Amycolatopsis cynarae TaxID=2995223 RepID=A0ABY7B7M1_9PSEU|nr:TetR/AcrR family transcriptional regulator [Amycolatopsis sp. HUAS 11-8]WAL67977.1 TetR/AcrR family transcriptional regulator [Amycolatopsis sp. HUAS 11-8]